MTKETSLPLICCDRDRPFRTQMHSQALRVCTTCSTHHRVSTSTHHRVCQHHAVSSSAIDYGHEAEAVHRHAIEFVQNLHTQAHSVVVGIHIF